jgi:BirA family biotin operon repressor/biotin-[acetyl-CoA-carboxylase] ligase
MPGRSGPVERAAGQRALSSPGRSPGKLSQQRLRRAVLGPAATGARDLWAALDLVAETGSTNEDLLAAARRGAGEGTVLVAERQTRGRGRLGRSWTAAAGTSLTFSALLRPAAVAPARRGWLPLLAGVAVVAAVRATAAVDASLKWPNDVLASPGGGKLAGILAEQAGDAVVIGIGMNVTAGANELPSPAATSLALQGAADTDRERLLVAILAELGSWYRHFLAPPAGDAVRCGLRTEYLRLCSTIGREVRAELPGGTVLLGTAREVDEAGRLVVRTGSGTVPISAGDVLHVR